MYDIIKEAIERNSDKIPEILEFVSSKGDCMIIKSDGLRDSLKYTVVISSTQDQFEAIRRDSDTLDEAIRNTLIEYNKHL